MSRRFIVFSDYGGFIPDVLKPLMCKYGEFPKNRCNKDLIGLIEERSKDLDGVSCEYFKEHKDEIVRVENRFYAYSSDKRYTTHFDIVEMEEGKQYMLSEYDGAESLHEVPKYRCIDSNLNFWEEIKNG